MATFSKTTGLTIQESFEKFHKANPQVYLQIVKQADKAIRAGKKKFSVKQIIGYVRWEVFMQTKEATLFEMKGETVAFKINDMYTSRYARLLISDYPHMEGKIEMRSIRSL